MSFRFNSISGILCTQSRCVSDELLAGLRPALAAARTASLAATQRIPRPIPVLVPAAQLGDWLKVRLARELGLSMGFEFLQPADYFGRHFATGKSEQSLARSHSFWAPDNLRWHILPLVETFAGKLGHDAGHSLLPRDRFAFAQVLAQQFDRYARHRPDWPNLWAAGKSGLNPGASALPPAALDDEQWQRDLWRSLAAQPGTPLHPAQWIAQHADAPDHPTVADSEPPLFIVGADLLDPLLLRTMQLLVHQGRTVSLHLLLPTLGYLGDQTRRNALLSQLAAAVPEETLELGGHPLLSSLGQQAVGNFLLLETLSPDYSAWPEVVSQLEVPPADDSLLQRLQADVRVQRTPPGPPLIEASADVRPPLAVADLSLRIHSCHSPRRELEVLRDELLRAFTDLRDLKPEEVLIAVTDFDTYAPLAQGILRGGPVHLPVRLTAIPSREANPVAVALLALLQLATGRHSASELVELLNLTALQQHLGLVDEPAGLAHLADTIRASGLTHDIDTSTRDHADATGTWRAALDRHLAGSWLGPISTTRDADGAFVHPLSPELHQADEVRLRFIRWLTLLAEQQLTWLTEAPASIWASRLETTVKTLLHASDNDDHAAAVLRLLGELKQVAATTSLDVGTLIDWLQPKLENATSLRTSMGGEILFGRLDQLHGLPCRVFALLGLQDGAFPRASRRPAWDLLAHRPERWDADSRRQDRQCFLDCLLTPTDRLILTAANRSLRTPHDGPLASCVEELLRTAAATVRHAEGTPAVEKQLVHLHRIQPFSTDYFADNAALPRSFDSTSARIAKNLLTASARPPTPFASASLSLPSNPETATTLTLAQLIQFWRDPAAAWLRALQVEIPRDEADDTALNDSPLNLNGLQNYLANEAALASRLPHAQIGAAEASALLIADRALPPRSTWRAGLGCLRPGNHITGARTHSICPADRTATDHAQTCR